jgi:hypothetical protein
MTSVAIAVFNKIANSVLHDVVYRYYQGFLYIKTFHDTRFNAVSFTVVRIVLSSLLRFSRNSHILNSIICRFLIHSLTQIGQ